MNTTAERIFGFVREATREHIRQGSVTEERQSTKPKRPQPEGFHQKLGGDFVAMVRRIVRADLDGKADVAQPER